MAWGSDRRTTAEAIHETCPTYECRKFGCEFTTYLQLSYAYRKSENLTDNQQLRLQVQLLAVPHLRACYQAV